jgi:cobyrinic acid a,c-diamide synthase
VLPERHLGLVLPDEVGQIDAMLDTMAEQLELDMQAWDALPETQFEQTNPVAIPRLLEDKKIAVARDAAFAFIYAANLDTLRMLGAELLFFLRLPISLFLPKPMPCICLAVILNYTRLP